MDKALLIKTYQEQQRQLQGVRTLVEKKRQDYEEMAKKKTLAEEVLKKAEEEKKNQEKRDQQVHDLEKLVLKAETLAARENSSQNSTPEAREINNEIEQEFDEVYKLEAKITQLKLDVTTFKQDIETIEKERTEKREIAINKLTVLYKNIQQLREEASQIRFQNLQNYIANEDEEVGAEIEIQKMQTLVTLYNELNNSMTAEFNSVKTPESSPMILETELNKIKAVSQQIPSHVPEPTEEQEKLNAENEALIQEISDLETKIMSSITEMSKEEDKQDELANALKESQQKSKKLLEKLRHQDNICSDIEKKIQDMKEQDATKKDKALEELDRLKVEIINLIEENNKKWEQIKLLKSGKGTARKTNSPIDNMCSKIRKDTDEIERQIEELTAEEESLKQQIGSEILQ